VSLKLTMRKIIYARIIFSPFSHFKVYKLENWNNDEQKRVITFQAVCIFEFFLE